MKPNSDFVYIPPCECEKLKKELALNAVCYIMAFNALCKNEDAMKASGISPECSTTAPHDCDSDYSADYWRGKYDAYKELHESKNGNEPNG